MGPDDNTANGPTFAGFVALTGKPAARRFYENVIFLHVLNQGFKGNTCKKSADLSHGWQLEDEDLFHNFVCRLGQICDSRKGGSTVTAFTILQHPSKVEYLFGSNSRTSNKFEITKAYITSILNSLMEASECEDDDQQAACKANLLRDVLDFNRDRIKCYLSSLKNALETCITICEKEGSSRATTQGRAFRPILECIILTKEADIDDDEYLDRIETLIGLLEVLQQQQATVLFIQQRANNDKAGNPEPWREFRHHSGRITAYKRAIEVLWYSGIIWPELFKNFEVTYIASSTRAPNPLRTEPQSAAEILSRFVRGEDTVRYMDLAETLQQTFRLDDLIKEEWVKETFRPLVHAEILVLNWLENNGGTRPERFFNNWRYIGSSKPTCKLCYYYIACHPSGVQFRGSHGNLYVNWKMPDSTDVHGLCTKEDALAKRHEISQGVGGRVRQDVLRTLREKVTDRRPHDSCTISTYGQLSLRHGNGVRLNSMRVSGPLVDEDWDSVKAESESGDRGTSLAETREMSSSPPEE